MSEEYDRLFAVLEAGALHAIEVASEDDGLFVEIIVTTNGLLIAAGMQKEPPYSHHRAPDGYCNTEISWQELSRIDASGLKSAIDDLPECAMKPKGVDGEGMVVPFGRPRR